MDDEENKVFVLELTKWQVFKFWVINIFVGIPLLIYRLFVSWIWSIRDKRYEKINARSTQHRKVE